MPIRERPGAVQRQRERRAVRAPKWTVEQESGGFARLEPKLQDRGGSGKLHRQCDVPGYAVGAMQIERDMRRLAGKLSTSFRRPDKTFAQHWRSQRQPVD